ncbi:hypothetical protein QC760_000356 [Botrytis cinerea]
MPSLNHPIGLASNSIAPFAQSLVHSIWTLFYFHRHCHFPVPKQPSLHYRQISNPPSHLSNIAIHHSDHLPTYERVIDPSYRSTTFLPSNPFRHSLGKSHALHVLLILSALDLLHSLA